MQSAEEESRQSTILLVDDNYDFSSFSLKVFPNQYHILKASNGKQALSILKKEDADLIISDVMMPEMDGLELCSNIKKDIRYSHIPIILLTAKASEEHQLEGLETGADDYITKPFALEELEARINVQLRKHHTDKDDGIIVQNLILYPDQRTFQIDDTKVSLTKHEYRIMELLMQYPKEHFLKKISMNMHGMIFMQRMTRLCLFILVISVINVKGVILSKRFGE